MYILAKSLNSKDGSHFPLILNYNIFNKDLINLDEVNLLYKSFILSFTFTKNLLPLVSFSAKIEDWATANEIFNDWVFYNILSDSFYNDTIKDFTYISSNFNWSGFIEFFKTFFSKVDFSFNGIDDWVEANYVYENWLNFGNSYYYEYCPYEVFEKMLDGYLTSFGWFVFIYLDKFDCKVIKDVLTTIPKEILLDRNLERLILTFNTNLSQKYGSIVISNSDAINKKKKEFIKFVFNLVVKSFTNADFIEVGYNLDKFNTFRDCIESYNVGYNLRESFKYNAFIGFNHEL